ncbi:hypothetical protein [Archangium violaceum]|uniref:Knr4/Smi1-like domain-containing protein n=1 Tax=Archangium violaceum Cb vi76 TaxID=1406225 RepID=A0A084ST26_9BACT|nr:hypothetical protein [Archangium violaceum]KFA91611.1 hypothetical protein Q664_20710 [Archangium violaceum Cb vi76]
MPLPGLDRLIEVYRKHGLAMNIKPPGRSPPEAGALVASHPFDPVLAAVYRRLGAADFGDESGGQLFLNRVDDQLNGIALDTEGFRRPEEPFHSSVIFGNIPGLAYYYAVVPKLADEQGRQPVIYIDAYMDRYVLPIASNVDRFFEALSHYVDMLMVDQGYLFDGMPGIHFPTSVPELIARDRRLVEMIVTGRFDFIMNLGDEFQDWLARVKSARG